MHCYRADRDSAFTVNTCMSSVAFRLQQPRNLDYAQAAMCIMGAVCFLFRA